MSLIDGDLSEVKQGDKVLCLTDGIFVSDINLTGNLKKRVNEILIIVVENEN